MTGIERRLHASGLLEEIDAERYATERTEPSEIGFYDRVARPAPLEDVSHPDGLAPAVVSTTPPPTPGRLRRWAGLAAGHLARDLHDLGSRVGRLARRLDGETL